MMLPVSTSSHGRGLPATATSLVIETAIVKARVIKSRIVETRIVEAGCGILVNERVGALGLVVSHLLTVGTFDAGD